MNSMCQCHEAVQSYSFSSLFHVPPATQTRHPTDLSPMAGCDYCPNLFFLHVLQTAYFLSLLIKPELWGTSEAVFFFFGTMQKCINWHSCVCVYKTPRRLSVRPPSGTASCRCAACAWKILCCLNISALYLYNFEALPSSEPLPPRTAGLPVKTGRELNFHRKATWCNQSSPQPPIFIESNSSPLER